LRIFRRHMWLHSELIPFFYAQHVQASLREGKLMHVGPGKHEFLLGDALLVAVMTGEEQNRVVTFPEGTWLDYWDNKLEYRGGQQVSVAVPEERSPVFVRLGSIIPLDVQNDAVNHGSAASKGWRTLDIYPAKEASQATLWDTASFPPNLQRDRTLVYLTPIDNEMEVRLEGGASRDTILRIRRFSAPTSVEADGKLLERRPNRASWEADRQGWWYDGDDRRLWIRLANARSSRVH